MRARAFPRRVVAPSLIVVVLIVAALTGCGGESDLSASSAESTSTTSSSAASTSAPTTSASTTTTEPFVPSTIDERSTGPVVTSVTDGDTFDVDLGGAIETVRIIGINAPEDGECLADQATVFLRDLIEGRRVDLITDVSSRDQYGRLLRYVLADGVDVGVELVRNGLALARRYPPDTDRAAILEVAQQDAEAASVGMWAPDACGPASGGRLDFGQIRFDAAGDDSMNLNDEWVQVVNLGSSGADLTGWGVKDESASNRYRFPDGFVLGSGATVTLRSGCGADTATDLHWCASRSAVWNNDGDTAFLLDPSGNIVATRAGP